MDSRKPKSSEVAGRSKGGRKPKISGELASTLKRLALDNSGLSLGELTALFVAKTKVAVNPATVRKTLAAAGVRQVRPTRTAAPVEVASPELPRRYGYRQMHRDEGDAERYPHGLTDAEWALVADLFENKGRGAPPKYPRRLMVDAIMYAVRGGVPWRMLPSDFPPWQDVYAHFRRWTDKRTFEQMHDRLRNMWREREHRAPEPTAGVLDSQSVKTSPQGGPKGFDAGKKVKGRKRHLVTDTLGLLLAVLITAACVQDRDAAMPALQLAHDKYPTLKKAYVDEGYFGRCLTEIPARLGIDVEVTKRPSSGNIMRWHEGQLPLFEPAPPKGFVVVKKRWVIERTNAWNDRPRRLARDQDRRLDVAAAWIWMVEGRLLLRRLVHGDGTVNIS